METLNFICNVAGFDRMHPEQKFPFQAESEEQAAEVTKRYMKSNGYKEGWCWPKEHPLLWQHVLVV